MRTEPFKGGSIEVLDFSDGVSGERVIEFRDHQKWGTDTFVAISVPGGGSWRDAVVSINPNIGDLLLWAIKIAKSKHS